jgi:thymidylate synthase (FAD)
MAEITRHRTGVAFSIESTRYCNYSKNKFGYDITVIRPFFFESDTRAYNEWLNAMETCEEAYLRLIEDEGATPQEARSVLPNSLKTDIVMTANLRTWRHIFKLRCSKKAHPQIKQALLPILAEFYRRVPVVFEDIYSKYEEEIKS